MKIIFGILLTFLTVYSYCQTDIHIEQLYKEKKYDEIIKYKVKKGEELTSKTLYHIGKAYYIKSDDNNALKYFSMAIEKGPVDHDMFYYKGMVLYYMDKYNESLPYFDKAIELLPNETDFYAGKGHVYYAMNNYDSAIVYFEKASKLPNCKSRVFQSMGIIYQQQNKINEALEVFKSAVSLLSQDDEDYRICSYNVGLMQQLLGMSVDSKESFEKHLSIYPTDYLAMSKLIQAYYALSDYDKVLPLKEKLYQAFKANRLPKEMKDGFCFDQFTWRDKTVMVFENFHESSTEMYIKHDFFILNGNNIEYKVCTKSSPSIRDYDSKNKYLLSLEKGNTHYSFWQFMFDDNYKYTELKSAVIEILEGKVEPGSFIIKE
jgi:tetratricopeptide (TPR) repeat protein